MILFDSYFSQNSPHCTSLTFLTTNATINEAVQHSAVDWVIKTWSVGVIFGGVGLDLASSCKIGIMIIFLAS